MHAPYAGIILFRFEGTVSAWPAANILAKIARAEADTGTPGASLMSISAPKEIMIENKHMKSETILLFDALKTHTIKIDMSFKSLNKLDFEVFPSLLDTPSFFQTDSPSMHDPEKQIKWEFINFNMEEK